MKLPTREEIEFLHRKYAPTEKSFQAVFMHCCAVCDVAEQLMERGGFAVNKDLVRVGCLLHDLGVYRLYKDGVFDEDKYICHGVLGEELLREEGFPLQICRFASHHTGVGITKQQIMERGLPLPQEDFLAESEEELLVMYADKFHSKSTPPRFNAAESYKAYVLKFGPENPVKFQEMVDHFGMPDLETLSKKYGYGIV